ncbi:uncharacterized protein MELLADRAFT_112702 [Melampsora larici-populina 98AG31]|uniref:Uncharacterized protein n=1 Tax=Melampsora larici-populina (strain 98AG31 / pathotype 3-4-7) TaxID=747676 RepID=F4S7B3_MELLP|nr:uncharacterized protein MELLADRAFT_112702 [Melampsora larici-populina 98AG31]EGF99488.1 hypothetical protein MELLADRAFT_112702 [Melampsora larici-populina 98AG31]
METVDLLQTTNPEYSVFSLHRQVRISQKVPKSMSAYEPGNLGVGNARAKRSLRLVIIYQCARSKRGMVGMADQPKSGVLAWPLGPLVELANGEPKTSQRGQMVATLYDKQTHVLGVTGVEFVIAESLCERLLEFF